MSLGDFLSDGAGAGSLPLVRVALLPAPRRTHTHRRATPPITTTY